jgi:hypothetical protein
MGRLEWRVDTEGWVPPVGVLLPGGEKGWKVGPAVKLVGQGYFWGHVGGVTFDSDHMPKCALLRKTVCVCRQGLQRRRSGREEMAPVMYVVGGRVPDLRPEGCWVMVRVA